MPNGPVWVVVADGGAARFFESAKRGAPLSERLDLATHAPRPAPSRERLPRVHDRMGPARHNIEPRRTPRSAAQDEFLKQVAAAINAAAEAKDFKVLIIAAPPRPLGVLRKHLSAPARQSLTQALAKDYVHATAAELDDHVRRLRWTS